MHQVMRMGHKQSGYRPPEQDRRLPALGIAFLLGGAGGSLACARLEWLRETLEQGGQASGTLWGALWPDLALLGVVLLSGFLRSGCMTALLAVTVKGFALSAISTAEVLRGGGSGYAQALCAQLIPGFLSLAALVLLGRQAMALSAARLRLPAGSKVMFGGGWKQFYTQKVEKETVYRLVEEVLGVPESGCVEFFGAVEHPILYCDCARHHFHVPVYSRVIIRDVDTLKPVPYGTPGLVNLLTPMTKSMPILSVMTDDIGILHPPGSCGCGISSPWLEILGRVGVKDIVTCAAGAEEYLENQG